MPQGTLSRLSPFRLNPFRRNPLGPDSEERLPRLLILPSRIVPTFLRAAFYMGVVISLCDWRMLTGYQGFVFLGNYIWLFQNVNFWYSAYLSFRFSLIVLVLELGIGLSIALLLNRPIRGVTLFRGLLVVPLMIPPIVGSVLWKVLMLPSGAGFLNWVLKLLGRPPCGFLGDPNTALWSLIIIDVWLNTPFVALVLLSGLQALPKSPFEAAVVDGASDIFTFRRLTLPLLKPFLNIVLIFRALDSLRVFDIVYGTTKGGPGQASRLLPIFGFEEAFRWFNLATGIATMLVVWFICRNLGQQFVKRLHQTY